MSIAAGLLTYQEVAADFGCSVRSARRLVAQKILRAVKIGHRTVRFRPVDIARAKAVLAGEEVREW